MKLLIPCVVVAGVVALFWWYNTPKTYEECIQKNIKYATSDTSARLVNSSCKSQFPRVYSEQEVFGVK